MKLIRLHAKERRILKNIVCFFGGIAVFVGLMWLLIHFTTDFKENKQEREQKGSAVAGESMIINITDENINKETVIAMLACYSGESLVKTRELVENLSSEQKEYLLSGEHSMSEMYDSVLADYVDNGLSGQSQTVRNIISALYALRNEYISALDGILNEAKQAVNAIPEEERTTDAVMDIADDAVDRGSQMEKECDAKVSVLLKTLRTNLEAENKNVSIIDDINKIYEEQKRIKKNELMSSYYMGY